LNLNEIIIKSFDEMKGDPPKKTEEKEEEIQEPEAFPESLTPQDVFDEHITEEYITDQKQNTKTDSELPRLKKIREIVKPYKLIIKGQEDKIEYRMMVDYRKLRELILENIIAMRKIGEEVGEIDWVGLILMMINFPNEKNVVYAPISLNTLIVEDDKNLIPQIKQLITK